MLADLIKKEPTVVEAEYRDGFVVSLRYVGLPDLKRAIAAQSKTVYRGGRLQDQGLTEAVEQAMVRAIVDWRGLTAAVLLTMGLDLDTARVEELGEMEIPCTAETKVVLLKHDADFRAWVQDTATNIQALREMEQEAARKNLPRS